MIHFYLFLMSSTFFQNPILVQGHASDASKKPNEFFSFAKILKEFQVPVEFKMIAEGYLSFENPKMYELETNLLLPTNDDMTNNIKLIGDQKAIKLFTKQSANLSTSVFYMIINPQFIKILTMYINKFWKIGEMSNMFVKIFNWISPIILWFYQNNGDCLDCIFNQLSRPLRDVPSFQCSCIMGYGLKELLEIIVAFLQNNENIN